MRTKISRMLTNNYENHTNLHRTITITSRSGYNETNFCDNSNNSKKREIEQNDVNVQKITYRFCFETRKDMKRELAKRRD